MVFRKWQRCTNGKWCTENDKIPPFNNSPLDDHDYYFKYPNGECVYVSQPYVSKTDAEPIIKQWAEKYGIKAEVYDNSYAWYNQNDAHICIIVVSLPERKVLI